MLFDLETGDSAKHAFSLIKNNFLWISPYSLPSFAVFISKYVHLSTITTLSYPSVRFCIGLLFRFILSRFIHIDGKSHFLDIVIYFLICFIVCWYWCQDIRIADIAEETLLWRQRGRNFNHDLERKHLVFQNICGIITKTLRDEIRKDRQLKFC